jgi:hypothetical protein
MRWTHILLSFHPIQCVFFYVMKGNWMEYKVQRYLMRMRFLSQSLVGRYRANALLCDVLTSERLCLNYRNKMTMSSVGI